MPGAPGETKKSFESPFQPDWIFTGIVVLLVTFGLIMVYSASFIYALEKTSDGFYFAKKQLLYAGLGTLGALTAYRLPYWIWKKFASILLLGSYVLLASTLVPGIGHKVGGAWRWIQCGPVRMQPAEILKFSILCFTAYAMSKQKAFSVLTLLGIFAPGLGVLLFQPDFGSFMIIVLLMTIVLFLGGLPWKYWAVVMVAIVSSAVGLILVAPYRWARWVAFLDPWQDPMGKGFQIIQSFVGLYRGNMLGVGLGNGKEKLFYLPEAHNDFIFSVIGEECGFVGLVIVIGLYFVLMLRGLYLAECAAQLHKDFFCYLLCVACTLLLGMQGLLNGGVVLGLLPTKGLTAPFISYGGSALMVDLWMVGIVLGLGRRKRFG